MYNIEKRKRIINAAAGRCKADIVIKNVNYLNVFSAQFEKGDIAICEGRIAGIGEYEGNMQIDGTGKYMVPGFIDGHVHFESSSVTPYEYAKTVVKYGTSAVIADPHEITNVCGMDGIRYMFEATDFDIMDAYIMIPSCVPATEFDENGADFGLSQIKEVYTQYKDRCLGLAEVMSYPQVVKCDEKVLGKLEYIYDNQGKIDGHAPGLTGKALNAYNAAGIYTDHECSTMEEAVEKLRNGEWIMVREGTAARNLKQLAGMFDDMYYHRVLLVTDDRHLNDLTQQGHIDYIIRKAIEYGAKPENVYICASYNAAMCFGLKETGAICPGYKADFVLLNNKETVEIDSVYKSGKVVYSKSKEVEIADKKTPDMQADILKGIKDTIHIKDVSYRDFIYDEPKAVIGIVPGELITTDEGIADCVDIENDIVKLCIVERHKSTGHIGKAYVKGYGLKSGAIATTVAHDSHNIIVAGVSEKDMAYAVMHLKKMGGGMVIVQDQSVIAQLELQIAGLMSERSSSEVEADIENLKNLSGKLGIADGVDPFMTLSFMSLPVIPHIKLVTQGVVDVDNMKLIK